MTKVIDPDFANINFDHTVNLCSNNLLNKTADEVLYNVYEEFDSSSWSYLHENTLNVLLESKMINREIFDLSVELRAVASHLFASDIERSVIELRRNDEWKRVFDLCDKIIDLKSKI